MTIQLFTLLFLSFFINCKCTEIPEEFELSKRFIIERNSNEVDLNETILLAEEHNFKFIDTLHTMDKNFIIFESVHNNLKRSSFNLTYGIDEIINDSMNQVALKLNVTSVHREKILERSKRDLIDILNTPVLDKEILTIPLASFVGGLPIVSRTTGRTIRQKSDKKEFGQYTEKDPMWPDLWYLNRHIYNKNLSDMNITSAWEMGYTGKGVSVTFLDDGLERTHPDIIQNYDPMASFDYNDNDNDPMPRYDPTNENKHGTRCAGEVAATANNSICSIGIAYNAGVGGIRMLDGPVTDSIEFKSLSLNRHHIDIYSASWGPTDDGTKLDGPDSLATQAMRDGVTRGRHGLGSIYTWASGNGGIYGDTCSCDGYVNSIYTFAISSTTDKGKKPWYLEECTSVLAATYSSGDKNKGESSIATTDLRHKCTTKHTATSAAAPIAAGIIALALEANPHLTWRDVMSLIVLTSRPKEVDPDTYYINKAGFSVSSRYGFGLMDAGRLVEEAIKWERVPDFHTCIAQNSTVSKNTKKNFDRVKTFLFTDGCEGDENNEVNFIEQVEIVISLRTPRRGRIELYLTSPMGTRHQILKKRRRDHSRIGFKNWAFNTLHLWGESPRGTWLLEVTNFKGDTFVLDKFELKIHGTKERPSYYDTLRNNSN